MLCVFVVLTGSQPKNPSPIIPPTNLITAPSVIANFQVRSICQKNKIFPTNRAHPHFTILDPFQVPDKLFPAHFCQKHISTEKDTEKDTPHRIRTVSRCDSSKCTTPAVLASVGAKLHTLRIILLPYAHTHTHISFQSQKFTRSNAPLSHLPQRRQLPYSSPVTTARLSTDLQSYEFWTIY